MAVSQSVILQVKVPSLFRMTQSQRMSRLLCLSLSLNLCPLFEELLEHEDVSLIPLEILTTLAVELSQKISGKVLQFNAA